MGRRALQLSAGFLGVGVGGKCPGESQLPLPAPPTATLSLCSARCRHLSDSSSSRWFSSSLSLSPFYLSQTLKTQSPLLIRLISVPPVRRLLQTFPWTKEAASLPRANVMVRGKRVPGLPKQQLTILAICRFAEPVAMTSVYPYIVSVAVLARSKTDADSLKWYNPSMSLPIKSPSGLD